MFPNEDLEPVEPGSPSKPESEDLACDSLSGYDRDSECGDYSNVEDSDDEAGGARKPPGVMNLKFQLDAAKAGQCREFHLPNRLHG